MSDYDRRDPRDPYGRGEPPLAFDARRPPPRESRPAPIALLVSAFVLVALVVAIAIFYFSGQRDGAGGPETVGDPVGEMKAAPPDTAQPADPAAGLQIYQSDEVEANATTPTFTAPPEEPAPRVPPPTPPVTTGGSLPPAAAPAPATPSAKAAPPTPAAKPAPAPTPAPKPATPPPAAKAPAPAAGAGGPAAVQIGAVSSPAAADAAWNEAARIAPGMAAGKGKSVQAIDRNGTTLYRTAVTGFSSRAEAAAFCDALKAAGKSCFVR
ncbi:MAG: SPOR domain-containing protein [Caulobacteraceae bacterium]|nr:SPOR domain-containing protein [Caulobacteraceae bacterium]